jgi:hypothetical protein
MSLPFGEFCELALYARKKDQEEEIRQQWVSILPFMYMKWLRYMSFQDYFDGCTGATIDRRPAQEIIDEILKAHGMKNLEDFKDGNI